MPPLPLQIQNLPTTGVTNEGNTLKIVNETIINNITQYNLEIPEQYLRETTDKVLNTLWDRIIVYLNNNSMLLLATVIIFSIFCYLIYYTLKKYLNKIISLEEKEKLKELYINHLEKEISFDKLIEIKQALPEEYRKKMNELSNDIRLFDDLRQKQQIENKENKESQLSLDKIKYKWVKLKSDVKKVITKKIITKKEVK